LNNLNIDTKAKLEHAEISEDPEDLALRERVSFNITVDEQIKWKDAYQAFNTWRRLIESKNMPVFQISMPLEDARGFSLVDEEPFVIIINSSDSIEARIFTLLHEYAHIILSEPGVCIPEGYVKIGKREAVVESWCNAFAAAFLFPKDDAKKEFSGISKSGLLMFQTLNKFSRRYKISRHMLLLHMLKLNFISKQTYEKIRDKMMPKKKEKRGFAAVPADKKCVQEKGEKFVSLVMRNVETGKITNNDALDYLSIKLKHLVKIRTLTKTE